MLADSQMLKYLKKVVMVMIRPWKTINEVAADDDFRSHGMAHFVYSLLFQVTVFNGAMNWTRFEEPFITLAYSMGIVFGYLIYAGIFNVVVSFASLMATEAEFSLPMRLNLIALTAFPQFALYIVTFIFPETLYFALIGCAVLQFGITVLGLYKIGRLNIAISLIVGVFAIFPSQAFWYYFYSGAYFGGFD